MTRRELLATSPQCKQCAEPIDTYEVRIDDCLVGTCDGVDERGRLIAYRPIIGNTEEKESEGTCYCGTPITQDSCPKCGTWHDLEGRR